MKEGGEGVEMCRGGREWCRRRKSCFVKQKAAYGLSASLVGSEMCIRERSRTGIQNGMIATGGSFTLCLPYTSDAADDLRCVDLGGRRIIKKKIPYSPSPFPFYPSHSSAVYDSVVLIRHCRLYIHTLHPIIYP